MSKIITDKMISKMLALKNLKKPIPIFILKNRNQMNKELIYSVIIITNSINSIKMMKIRMRNNYNNNTIKCKTSAQNS